LRACSPSDPKAKDLITALRRDLNQIIVSETIYDRALSQE